MKKFLLFIFLAFLAVGGFYWQHTYAPHQSAVHADEQYQCPMHPQIVQDHPGNCPICGMNLVKVEKTGVAETESKQDMPVSHVPSHVSVHLTEAQQAVIGVQTEEVIDKELKLPLRLTGKVYYNPQIYQLLLDYQEAIQVEQRYQKPLSEIIFEARAKSWNTRTLLRRMGLADESVEKIKSYMEDPTNFVPSHVLFEADGGYVDARVPVSDLLHVKPGQQARIFSSLAPDQELEGVVRSIDGVVDAATQTIAVRIEVLTGYEFLKPGQFVDVEMDLNLGKTLSMPVSALFQPGKMAYVFTEKESGVFVPTEIKQGVVAGERVQILSGLEAGDKIVTTANFLLDSESRFQAARSEHPVSGGHSHG